MGAMLVAALAIPGAFGDDAILFAPAYLLVRVLTWEPCVMSTVTWSR